MFLRLLDYFVFWVGLWFLSPLFGGGVDIVPVRLFVPGWRDGFVVALWQSLGVLGRLDSLREDGGVVVDVEVRRLRCIGGFAM